MRDADQVKEAFEEFYRESPAVFALKNSINLTPAQIYVRFVYGGLYKGRGVDSRDAQAAKMNYHLISDTHFNHLKLEEWEGRSGNWQEQLWAGLDAIPAGDTLIHLGDICIGEDRDVHEKILAHTGAVRRILVRGNHDKASLSFYTGYWDFVCDSFSLETLGHRILFSHRPRNPDADNFTHNIHGHTHGNLHRSEEYNAFYSPGYHIDISPELIGYRPIRLDKLMGAAKKVKPLSHER